MLSLIGKRLMFAIPSLIGVVIVTFLLTRALPGDPAAYFAGPAASKEAIEQIRKKLGFDRPLIEQFFRYTNVFSGWLDYPEYFFIWCYDGKNSIFNTMSYQSKAMDLSLIHI